MAQLVKKINQNMKELLTYAENTEARLLFMKEGMLKLLNEEDIMQLPSYKLIKQTYYEYLDTDISISKKPAIEDNIYDTLHLPPQIRNRNKRSSTQIKREISEKAGAEYLAQEPTPTVDSAPELTSPPKQRFATRNLPDFSENMLDDPAPKPLAKTARTKVTPTLTLTPTPTSTSVRVLDVQADGLVYRVEIRGILYYLHGKYLYSNDTMLRVGMIETDFIIGDQRYPIEEKLVLSPEEDYYLCNDKAYILLSDTVSQCVGEINEDRDICLYV
jgi:hypothetical protein